MRRKQWRKVKGIDEGRERKKARALMAVEGGFYFTSSSKLP